MHIDDGSCIFRTACFLLIMLANQTHVPLEFQAFHAGAAHLYICRLCGNLAKISMCPKLTGPHIVLFPKNTSSAPIVHRVRARISQTRARVLCHLTGLSSVDHHQCSKHHPSGLRDQARCDAWSCALSGCGLCPLIHVRRLPSDVPYYASNRGLPGHSIDSDDIRLRTRRIYRIYLAAT
jgi:hypothetical protein